jgi:hypothetical protein
MHRAHANSRRRTLASRSPRGRRNRIPMPVSASRLDAREALLRAVRADVRALIGAGFDRVEIARLIGYGSRDMVDKAMNASGVLLGPLHLAQLAACALAAGGGAVARYFCGLAFRPLPTPEACGDGDIAAESLLLAEAHGGALVEARRQDAAALRRHACAVIRAGQGMLADADAIARAMEGA